jgi:alkylation response protein AidB-like acyl-CoA dehydrogenase
VLIGPGAGAVVDLAASGVTVRRLEGIDLTRSHAHVAFDGAAAHPLAAGRDWPGRALALAAAASTAKVACSQAFTRLTSDMIRVHGGIGFTWEHEAHLYFRRARASAQLFGDVAVHSDRIVAHAGL